MRWMIVAPAESGANEFKALIGMLKSAIMLTEQPAMSQQQHDTTRRQLQMLEARLGSEFTAANARIQASADGTLNAVMQALMEQRSNPNNAKKEMPTFENKALLNQTYWQMIRRGSSCGTRDSSMLCHRLESEPGKCSMIS